MSTVSAFDSENPSRADLFRVLLQGNISFSGHIIRVAYDQLIKEGRIAA